MPKPFPILIEVEEVALGKVMRSLHTMPGVIKIYMDMDQAGAAAPKSGRGGAMKQYAETGEAMVLRLLSTSKKPLETRAFVQEARAQGRAVPSSPLNALKRKGLIRQPKPLFYELTAKGKDHLAKKAKAKAAGE